MKWILRIFGALVLAGGALVVAAMLLDTKVRPAPAASPGYFETTAPAPHRNADIPVFVWYPTDAAAAPELLAQNALFYGHYAQRDAAPATGPFPVVLLSHGSGGNAPHLGWLARQLALSGMIVVGTNHPGTTSRDSDPFQTIRIWERPADLTALLDWVIASDLPANPARVGAIGFSLGGHSALALSGARVSKAHFINYCASAVEKPDCTWMASAGVDFTTIDQARYEADMRDPRISATVAIDPALPLATLSDSLKEITHPVLVVNLGEDTPAATRADMLAAAIPNATYHIEPGSWHFSMLAECAPLGRIIIGLSSPENICSDMELRPRSEVHNALADQIVPFLTEALK